MLRRCRRALAERGLRVVITGTGAERPLCHAVATSLGSHAVVAAGRTGIGELGALVDGAAIVLTNDTGTSHLAVARGTPSVVVVPPGLAPTWSAARPERHPVVAGRSGQVDPGAVIDVATKLLDGTPAGSPAAAGVFVPEGPGEP